MSTVFHGLRFETRAPLVRASTARADVACFVGFAAVRPAAEAFLRGRYAESGWRVAPEDFVDDASLPPVLVESIEGFDALFDGWIRPADGRVWEGYLSGAVHDFFRQGGRRAWVVPVGAPIAPEPDGAQPHFATVRDRLKRLIPGVDGGAGFARSDRSTWSGLSHLIGLPEVAFACLPDLPGLVGAPTTALPAIPGPPGTSPEFVECSLEPPLAPPDSKAIRAPGAPRLGVGEMARWQCAVAHATHWIKRHRPDVELVLSLPLRTRGSRAETNPLDDLVGFEADGTHEITRSRLWPQGAPRNALSLKGQARMVPPTLTVVENATDIAALDGTGIGSAFVHLAFPWVIGDMSLDRPDQLGPPDGVAAGILARATLRRGTFRSLMGERPEGVAALEPVLTPIALARTRPPERGSTELALRDRLLLFGETPHRLELLSDVTTSSEPRWKSGGTNRLLGVVHRALREIGQELLFEPNGRAAWGALVERVRGVLAALADQGGLGGEPPFSVRCDRRTMTQSDIDAGRMVAEVTISPALPIGRITVVMTVSDGSSVSLSGERGD